MYPLCFCLKVIGAVSKFFVVHLLRAFHTFPTMPTRCLSRFAGVMGRLLGAPIGTNTLTKPLPSMNHRNSTSISAQVLSLLPNLSYDEPQAVPCLGDVAGVFGEADAARPFAAQEVVVGAAPRPYIKGAGFGFPDRSLRRSDRGRGLRRVRGAGCQSRRRSDCSRRRRRALRPAPAR